MRNADDNAMVALRARWLFTNSQPPIADGMVTVDGNRVIAVGENLSGKAPVELGDIAILPGLVNAHTHLEFSDLQRPLGSPGQNFSDWIRTVVSHRRDQAATGGDAAMLRRAAVIAGVTECKKSGVGTVGEIATEPWFPQILSDGGLHGTVFLELLGLRGDRVPSLVQAAFDHLSLPRQNDHHWTMGLSPHAPYTVHPDVLRQSIELSAKHRAPLAMHLAESADEIELLRDGRGPMLDLLIELDAWQGGVLQRGLQPLDYLQQLALAHRALVIHGNFLEAGEWEFLAEHSAKMAVVYCPRTHAYFGHPRYPLAAMLRHGVGLAIGTDSRASNPDLSLFEELRFAARQHPDVAPAEILRMGTGAASSLLGHPRSDRLSFVALPRQRSRDPYEWLFADGSHVTSMTRVTGIVDSR